MTDTKRYAIATIVFAVLVAVTLHSVLGLILAGVIPWFAFLVHCIAQIIKMVPEQIELMKAWIES